MSLRFIRTSGGFTLIELIVSISILAMLSMAFLRQSEMAAQKHKNQEYINAIETVMASFRTARTNAITSKITALPLAPPENIGVPPGGYGTHLEILPNELIITEFADIDDELSTGTADGIYNEGIDTVFNKRTIKTFWNTSLEADTYINGNPWSNNTKELSVIFLPGDAEMIINDNVDNSESHALLSVEVVFNYTGLPKRMCLNRVSKFIETISGETCS